MSNKITRTFHPVGQGAFYSERINDFNFVYDCGSSSNKVGREKVVRQSFDKDDVIDLLAISHFDEDHINLIPILKNTVKKIKAVIFPLMSSEQKAYVLSAYENSSLYEIVLDPQRYFKNAKIIWVNPADAETIEQQNEPLYLENLQLQSNDSIEIESGRIIHAEKSIEWGYIPYNHDNKERNQKIKELFAITFKDDDKFNIKDIAGSLSDREIRKKLRSIYEIVGGTNKNSLLMYSGPLGRKYDYIKCFFRHFYGYFPYSYTDAAGCLYTGDATINKDVLPWIGMIKSRYPVGTIQIPHHGSLNSFNKALLQNGPFHCVISAGQNNRYKHPSCKVLEDILLRDMYPIVVTDDATTGFIEYIVHE